MDADMSCAGAPVAAVTDTEERSFVAGAPIGLPIIVIVDPITGAIVDLITGGATREEIDAFYIKHMANTY